MILTVQQFKDSLKDVDPEMSLLFKFGGQPLTVGEEGLIGFSFNEDECQGVAIELVDATPDIYPQDDPDGQAQQG